MTKKAKKITLPRFVVTEAANAADPASERVELPARYSIDAYHVRPLKHASTSTTSAHDLEFAVGS
jgi:hypothetical protein